MDLKTLHEKVRPFCIEANVKMLGVFGSVARGEDHTDSDIDLIISFKNPVGLIELIRTEQRLSELLGRRVDLGTESCLHPLIAKKVASELKTLYVS